MAVAMGSFWAALAAAESPRNAASPAAERAEVADAGSWVERFDGGYCSASARVFADRCEVRTCERTSKVWGVESQGEFIVTFGDGMQTLVCGQADRICGKTYECRCEQCDPSVN